MSVQEITTNQLRRMEGKEGLILQGCGGTLLDWQGNRRLENGSILAGPFFVVGVQGENFRSLTDEETSRYLQRYAQPQEISPQEVQQDMGFCFISF